MRSNSFLKAEAARPTKRLSPVLALTIAASATLGACAGTAGTSAPGYTSTIGIMSEGDGKGTVLPDWKPAREFGPNYTGSNYAPIPGR
jgi:hypothetical protein